MNLDMDGEMVGENRPYSIIYGGRDAWKAIEFAPTLEEAQQTVMRAGNAFLRGVHLVEIIYDDVFHNEEDRLVARYERGVWTTMLFQVRFGVRVTRDELPATLERAVFKLNPAARVELVATLDEAVAIAEQEPECPHVVILQTDGEMLDQDATVVAARVGGEWSTFHSE